MNAMDESGSPWPGFVYRVYSNIQDELEANITTSTKFQQPYYSPGINNVVLKRINGVLYLNIDNYGEIKVLDFSTLSKVFDTPLTFGASLDGKGLPQRYFNGSLKYIKVIVYE